MPRSKPAKNLKEDRRVAFARVDAAAAARFDAWPEWKKNPTQVPVTEAVCHLCNQTKPAAELVRTALIGTTSIWECRDAGACNGQPRSRVRRIL
jgi:hypothetical protein